MLVSHEHGCNFLYSYLIVFSSDFGHCVLEMGEKVDKNIKIKTFCNLSIKGGHYCGQNDTHAHELSCMLVWHHDNLQPKYL